MHVLTVKDCKLTQHRLTTITTSARYSSLYHSVSSRLRASKCPLPTTILEPKLYDTGMSGMSSRSNSRATARCTRGSVLGSAGNGELQPAHVHVHLVRFASVLPTCW